ncbi:hypothetical protein HNR26_002504 [Rhizobium rosettiformans]|uniref:Transmembrane anchored protein n=3 Tax=Rhizobium rosettiformans TaxID=1368430 RepID=A0A4S8PWE9_9HYPH|nr:hypothetical protein [Rhizobium rosettiformans]MBB5276435.1 hypothetical protein [Rhizobium rosettiformans]THV35953.1 hypothetical protein FAA86_11505 [Rhizobium rosettiformans W3]
MRGEANTVSVDHEQRPLISNRFLVIATMCVLVLAAASVAISWFGRSYGEQLSLAGHSQSTDIVNITVGRDQLALPENVIRFEEQRQGGLAERVDLYLLWPEMTGYSPDQRRRFDDLSLSNSLIFLQISQSTMSRDMSGRVEPIYRHLLERESTPGPADLSAFQFKDATGYEGETLLTGTLPDGATYAIRCLLTASQSKASGSDCQRDIHVGEDLTVLYRFSSDMLKDWAAIDAAVRSYVGNRAHAVPAAATLKNQLKASTGRSS